MRDPFVEFDPKLVPTPPQNVFLTFSVFVSGLFLGGITVGAFLV